MSPFGKVCARAAWRGKLTQKKDRILENISEKPIKIPYKEKIYLWNPQ